MDEKKAVVARGSGATVRHDKEDVKILLRRISEKIHNKWKGKKQRYTMSAIMTDNMPLSKEEVEALGFRARPMPTITPEDDNG